MNIKRFSDFILILISSIIISSIIWAQKNFGTITAEQLLFHLSFGMDLINDTPEDIIESYILKVCITSFLISASFLIIKIFLCNFIERNQKISFKRNLIIFISLVPFIFFGTSIAVSIKKYKIINYLSSIKNETFFKENYINPKSIKITKTSNSKNLILVYMESIETSYSNARIFKKNLLESIDRIEGIRFSEFRQTEGTNWTAASVVSSQCGIPLKTISIHQGHAQGEKLKYYLPNAICLGDILKENGYKNILLAGANLKLAAIDKFAQQHGYDKTYGKLEWEQNPSLKEDISKWGLFDNATLDQAKIELLNLIKTKQPYNLTVMTIDTHGPEGRVSRFCQTKGAKNFEDIIECSTVSIADFINFALKQNILDTSNIVIIGDHLVMSDYIEKKLKNTPERFVYNLFISKDNFTKNREELLHFDLLPSILNFIGFEIEGNKLGLGYNAFNSQNLTEADRYKYTQENILKNSDVYLDLWKK